MAKDDVKIDSKMKTKITNDWLAEFPEYKKIRPCLWKKRVGCVAFGMGYDVGYGINIKPACSVFNLSNPLDFTCANLKTEPKSRWKINWPQHERGLYKEMAEELRQFATIPIEGDVTLSQVIDGYKKYTENIVEERHFEDPALIAAWCGRLDVARDCLDWGMKAYQAHCKVPYQDVPSHDTWYSHMLTRISDPDALRRIVDEQIKLHKLEKVSYQELIVDI